MMCNLNNKVDNRLCIITMNPSTSSMTPSRFTALRYRDFRLLWLGQFVSITGTQMRNVAIASSRDIFGCSKNRQNRIVENSTYPLDDFGFR